MAIQARIGKLGWMRILQTMPGVGKVLGATIWVEIGDIHRFPSPQHLARYAGLVPREQSSGGKTWRGPTPKDCNHYLKWAYVEAGQYDCRPSSHSAASAKPERRVSRRSCSL